MLPERIKRYRKEKGLTQRELAALLDCNPATISCYESGWRTPSIKKLLVISVLLGCSIDDLTAEEEPVPALAAEPDEHIRTERLRLRQRVVIHPNAKGVKRQRGGEHMSEQPARPYPVTIVGRLSIEYRDGVTSGAGEYAIPAGFLQEVIALVVELQEKYPQLT